MCSAVVRADAGDAKLSTTAADATIAKTDRDDARASPNPCCCIAAPRFGAGPFASETAVTSILVMAADRVKTGRSRGSGERQRTTRRGGASSAKPQPCIVKAGRRGPRHPARPRRRTAGRRGRRAIDGIYSVFTLRDGRAARIDDYAERVRALATAASGSG